MRRDRDVYKKKVVPLFTPVVYPPQGGGSEEEGTVEVGNVLWPCKGMTRVRTQGDCIKEHQYLNSSFQSYPNLQDL